MTLNSLPDNYKSLQFNRLANSLALSDTSKKKNSNFQSTIAFLSLFVTLFLGNSVMGQVSITKPNLSIPVCSGFPSAYFNLDDIVIAETFTSDFLIGTDRKLILTIPTNFEFQAGTGGGTIAFNGNITSASISITTTTITITYTCTNTNKGDFITINGLKVRAINNASTGNITRTAGGISDGIINGLIVGTTLTNTLKSTIETPPTTANAGPMQTLVACATTATLAGNTPSAGTGIWTVVTGSATVTSPNSPTSGVTGLAIGATATLRWTISNGICGSTSSEMTITTSMGPGCLVYCTSVGGTFANGIKGIVFNTINNTGTPVNVPYTNYTGISTTLIKGNSYNLSIYLDTGGNYRDYQSVWIDWNANGVFTDLGEFYNLGSAINVTNGLSSLSPYSIFVPAGASTAAVRMRIQSKYGGATSGSCDTSFDGEVEDYTINIIDPPLCATPNAPPKILSLTSTINSINGSFTPANPAADNYLVVINTSGVTPTPVNGTTYTIGSTALGGTNIVVDTDGNSTFTASGLSASTLYYIYVFSFNSLCSGGPLYRTTSILSGNKTTIAANYCTPSVSSSGYESLYYINKVNFIGNITNSNNSSTYSSSPLGYQNFTTLGTRATQAQGEGVNIYVDTNSGNKANYMKSWVDWDNNGFFDESNEIVYQCTNAFINTTFGFKIPETATPGNYRIRIRINRSSSPTDNTFGPCDNIANYGETEDYLFTVVANCATKITSIIDGFNCGEGSVTLGATASTGTTSFRWYTSQTGGSYISTASNTWTTPSITTTTTYYVTAYNGSCESLFRTPILATIKPVPTLTFANVNPSVCGENSIIDLQASASNEQVFLIDENFENGLGSFTNINIASPDAAKTNWQTQSSTYVPTYPTFPVWYPAISSGFGTNKFAMTTSDVVAGGTTFGKVETALESTAVNTTGFLNLSLSFKIYFSSYNDSNSASVEFVNVEVSTNGGTSWLTTPIVQYLGDVGIGTQFVTPPNFNLNAYTGITSLKIRIRYKAGWNDGVAIDDIKLFGDKPLSPSFQWTSALPIDAYTNAACTISYTAGTPATIVYVKPTLAQLEQNKYSFTAKANLANGCSTSAIINVTNTTKVWKGTTNNEWNNSNNWLPSGIPTADNCVIIPTGTNAKIINTPDAFAKNVTIKQPTGNLELQSGRNLTVTDFVNVETGGVFNVRNNASLVQITDADNNIGIVNIQRISKPMTKLDYTYWNSPIKTSSGFTLGNLSANSSHKYSWIPTVSNGSGNWQYESSSTVMDPRKGYIVRAPDNHTSGNSYTATFIGTPNNGLILAPISRGTNADIKPINPLVDDEDDEWNLIGNPYPSGLSITKFIDHPNNLNVVDGTVYIWMHNTQPSAATPDPFYGDYVLNYTSEDYATLNKTGATVTASAATTGGIAPTDFIASGQSFFIKSANTMPNGTTANATFNNSMRESGKNSSFAKKIASKEVEKNRIWLNLTNNSGAFSQILVGYLAEATQGLDRGFDGENLGGNDVTFYSIIPEAQLTIQGRALPFDPNDEVRLGYNSAIKGSLSIRIDHTDGLINTQRIYLEDKLFKIIHNLREKPYVFDTEEGDFNDRFVLRYRPSDKKTETIADENPYGVKVIVNQNVTVLSPNELIKNIIVYDMSGRKIDSYKKVDSFNFILNHLNKTTAGLILRITLDNNEVVSQKIFY